MWDILIIIKVKVKLIDINIQIKIEKMILRVMYICLMLIIKVVLWMFNIFNKLFFWKCNIRLWGY